MMELALYIQIHYCCSSLLLESNYREESTECRLILYCLRHGLGNDWAFVLCNFSAAVTLSFYEMISMKILLKKITSAIIIHSISKYLFQVISRPIDTSCSSFSLQLKSLK